MSDPVRDLVLGAGLDPAAVAALAGRALAEDLAGGADITTLATVPAGVRGTAAVVARRSGVLAGLPVAAAVFDLRLAGDGRIEPVRTDGEPVEPGARVLTVTGPVAELLTAERSALNLLCHLSGVATLTRAWVDAVAGTGAVIRDTRKTTVGLRDLEKYAVRQGGGVNHRMSLSAQALIKDNHVRAAGGVARAIAAVRASYPDVVCEVECDTLDQVRQALAAGAELLLLDNMATEETRTAVRLAQEAGARTEASGGLVLDRAAEVAGTGVDLISVGALTHSAPVLDLGLDLR